MTDIERLRAFLETRSKMLGIDRETICSVGTDDGYIELTTSDLSALLADYERLRGMEERAVRVIRAFEAHGRAKQTIDDLVTRRECERAMVALKESLVPVPGGEGK